MVSTTRTLDAHHHLLVELRAHVKNAGAARMSFLDSFFDGK